MKYIWCFLRPSDVTHICVGNLTIIGSDNGLSPGRRQVIILTTAGLLLIGPLGTNANEILIEIHAFSLKEMHLKMSSGKRRPFCLGLMQCVKQATPERGRVWHSVVPLIWLGLSFRSDGVLG